MSGWKRITNYQLIDNTTLQTCVNRIGHVAMTWLLVPMMMAILTFLSGVWLVHFSKETVLASIAWGPGLVFLAAVMHGYYVPKGYRRYFYVVCAAPAVIGLLLSIACLGVVLVQGFPVAGK
ncbi:MAG: hypothetical protein Q8Q80_03845 [Methyloversatilis sp.]|jgi:hypothetical protein|uniref:hypothetical protein n=1 Tax=Methyloversatilis sp. TaxID=2569862 RepID=UPI002733436D|nr:hypothetical protein [Methyloversatilis sp.]MDP3871773.1 hypothetical protein [Methyloversatilis sp.]